MTPDERGRRETGARRRRDRALGRPIEPTLHSIARIAGELGHELNNQLAAVLHYTYVLSKHIEDDPTATEHLTGMREAAWRASGLAEQLLTFSQAQRVPPIGTRLEAIISDLEPLLLHGLDPDRQLKIILDDDLHSITVARGPIESLLLRAALIKHRCGRSMGPLLIEAHNDRLEVQNDDGTAYMGDFVRLEIGPLPSETTERRVVEGGMSSSTRTQLLSERVRSGLAELGADIEASIEDGELTITAWLPAAR